MENEETLRELADVKEKLVSKTKEFEEALEKFRHEVDTAIMLCSSDAQIVETTIMSLTVQRDQTIAERDYARKRVNAINAQLEGLQGQMNSPEMNHNRKRMQDTQVDLVSTRDHFERMAQTHNREMVQLEGALHRCTLERESAICDAQEALRQVKKLKELVEYYEEEKRRQDQMGLRYYWRRLTSFFGSSRH
mmetsp:Transcript_45902/g.55699  ORF Transcript_45902/g.55699 Transcript_45902/m.55699 type:complete len:192 (-) Transcript_45902:217-792(-)